ncbi:hypothetical protein [Thioclava sp. F1Mire-8]|uniref:hypothetical protein n=1 Tax=Thioclava sp. F1Mire-8 TaxID=1973006 RepID=UPI0019802228|nr:hypothetical protein [Thioclava sp. F1Mire-8]
MLETVDLATIAKLAEREGIAPSYMPCVLWLTLLASAIVEAIFGRQAGGEVTLARAMEPSPAEWGHQRSNVNATKSGA